MIILDTNVVSEVMRRDPSPAVLDFLDSHADTTLYLTSITVAEVLCGVRANQDPAQREDSEPSRDADAAHVLGP